MPFDHWRKGVDSLCENNTLEVIQKKQVMLQDIQKESDIQYEYLGVKVLEALLVVAEKPTVENKSKYETEIAYEEDAGKTTECEISVVEEDDYTTYRYRICDFVEKTLRFYQKFFKESAFDGEMEMLPLSCRVAVKLYDALAKEENGDYKSVLENLIKNISRYDKKYLQYFGKDIITCREDEVFVDYGGFTGDTTEEFINDLLTSVFRLLFPDRKGYQITSIDVIMIAEKIGSGLEQIVWKIMQSFLHLYIS